MLPVSFFMMVSASAFAQDPIEGVWLTKGGESHVKIVRCEKSLCNEIIWLKEPNGKNGKPLHDNLNKDSALRGRPIMGMPILESMKQVDKYMWRGRVYKPRHGKTYSGHVRLMKGNALEVKGCHAVLPICKTQYWSKVRDLEENELQAAKQ